MQPNCPASIHICALRVARLDPVTGAKVAGSTNGYVTSSIGTITPKPVYHEGSDIAVPNACGGLVTTYKGRNILRRLDLDLRLLTPDPELDEMIAGSSLLLGQYGSARVVSGATVTSGSPTISAPTANFTSADVGAAVTGTGIPANTTILSVTNATTAVMSANATGAGTTFTVTPSSASTIGSQIRAVGVEPTAIVSIEAWSRAILPNGRQDTVMPWFQWVWPWVALDPGDNEMADSNHEQNYSGFVNENPLFGSGPFGDWTTPITRAQARRRVATIPTAQCGYLAVA